MIPPFISYITFNRLGLTIRNLTALLDSTEDFEMHIIDCNSSDGTRDYIMSLNDNRIKTRECLDVNHGKVYALNYHLVRRQPEQYFFTVDHGIQITTEGWIGKFLKVFEEFPEAGLLGVRADDGHLPPVVPHVKGRISYLELNCGTHDIEKNHIPDFCMCLRPDLIGEIGYFSEENYYGHIELSYRVCRFTGYKAGFIPDVHILLPGFVPCGECLYKDKCRLGEGGCFAKYEKYHKNEEFLRKNKWRFEETVRDMESGARPAYCASLLDTTSTRDHAYNREWATANIVYFIKNAN